jgi:hypothetical protein
MKAKKELPRPRCKAHGTLLCSKTGRCVLFDHVPRGAKAKVEVYLKAKAELECS